MRPSLKQEFQDIQDQLTNIAMAVGELKDNSGMTDASVKHLYQVENMLSDLKQALYRAWDARDKHLASDRSRAATSDARLSHELECIARCIATGDCKPCCGERNSDVTPVVASGFHVSSRYNRRGGR